MTIFMHEDPKHHLPITHRFFPSALRNACVHCHSSSIRRLSLSSTEDENDTSDVDDQQVIILAVRSWARKSKRRREDSLMADGLSWVFSPTSGEFFIAPSGIQGTPHKLDLGEEQETQSFYSARSCLSLSSVASIVDYRNLPNRALLEAFCNCEGWPFGLYRKSLILPPLPQSPSESWSWCRQNRMGKMT